MKNKTILTYIIYIVVVENNDKKDEALSLSLKMSNRKQIFILTHLLFFLLSSFLPYSVHTKPLSFYLLSIFCLSPFLFNLSSIASIFSVFPFFLPIFSIFLFYLYFLSIFYIFVCLSVCFFVFLHEHANLRLPAPSFTHLERDTH